MPLAVAVGAGEDGDAAGRVDPHRRRLVEPGPRPERADQPRRRQPAALDPGREAEAAQPPAPRRLVPPRLEAGVVRDLEQLVERRVVVARIVDHRERRLVRELLRLHEVPAPDLDRVEPHLPRRLVDQPLELVGALRPPGAAIGVDRHGVGEDRPDVHVGERRPVRPARRRPVQVGRRHRREGPQVGAEVRQRLGAEREERPVLVERELDLRHMVAPLRVGDEGLRPARGPLHRPPQQLRRPGDEGLLAVVEDLRAEGAADVGRHHPELVLRDVEHEGAHQEPDHVRVLARRPERVLVVPGSYSPIAQRGSIGFATSRLLTSSSVVT